MNDQMVIAYVGGAFALAGVVIGSALTFLNSFLAHRREQKAELVKATAHEHAILSGAFALTNFVNARLNEFDETKNIFALTRLTVAQSYMAALVDKVPVSSDRLMIALVGLGLRLEATLYILGAHIGSNMEIEELSIKELEVSLNELNAELEIVDLFLNAELPITSIDELIKDGILTEAEADHLER